MKKLLFALSILLFNSCGEENITKPSDNYDCIDISDMPEGKENTSVRIINFLPYVDETRYDSFELRDFENELYDLSSYYITDKKSNVWYLNELQGYIIVKNENCPSFIYEYYRDTGLESGDSIILFDSLDNKIQTFIIP